MSAKSHTPFPRVTAARRAQRPILAGAHRHGTRSRTDMSEAMFAVNRVFTLVVPCSSPHGARILRVHRRRAAPRAGSAETPARGGNVVSRARAPPNSGTDHLQRATARAERRQRHGCRSGTRESAQPSAPVGRRGAVAMTILVGFSASRQSDAPCA